MGAETLAHLENDSHELRVVVDWKTSLIEGKQVHAQFASGATHVFDNTEMLVTTL